MADLPQLPDTDDPFELLGVVEAEADTLALRRAYVRLIKRYRPEQAPNEFHRIRTAYEHAKERLTWRSWAPAVDVDDDDMGTEAPGAEASDEQEPVESVGSDAVEPNSPTAAAATHEDRSEARSLHTDDSAAAKAQRLWHNGDAAEALQRAKQACTDTPADARGWWIASRAALATGQPLAACHQWLLDGLVAGAPLAVDLVTQLPVRERDQLAAHPDLSWLLLERQPARHAAVALMRSRIEELLFHDQLQQAYDEVSASEFLRASVAEPELEPIALRVVAAFAWQDPDRAAKLYRHFQSTVSGDWELQQLHERIGHATHLRSQTAPETLAFMPPDLRRLLCVLPILSPNPSQRCLVAAKRSVSMNPAPWLRAFDAMAANNEDLLMWLHDVLDGHADFQEDREPSGELSELAPLMKGIDGTLDKATVNRVQNVVMGILLLGFLPAIRVLHWWAIGYGLVAFIVAIIVISMLDKRMYAEIVRPRLAAWVVERGTAPGRFIAWMAAHSQWSDNIGRFDSEIEEDLGLVVLAKIHGLTHHADNIAHPSE
ncbi:MAG: hypothetical protein KC502_12520 [Myxococcales bacterium]|nr:hypothetical protein [Myxococcales bacterium]